MTERVYMIARADLAPAQQAVQAAHGLACWMQQYPAQASSWAGQDTLVFLTVPDEGALKGLAERMQERGCTLATWREPDLGDSLTSVAVGPEARPLLRGLPLALQP